MSKRKQPAPVASFASEVLPPEVQRSVRRLARMRDVRRVALMPDVHLAEGVCVGTVFATEHLVYPGAVGGDIGCGVSTVALVGDGEIAPDAARELLAAWRLAVPVHRRKPVEGGLEAEPPCADGLSCEPLRRAARELSPTQLGTLGAGNHFLELQQDDAGTFWLAVHSGSRGLGRAIRAHHAGDDAVKLKPLDAREPEGRAYLDDMAWARAFAASNRRAMLRLAEIATERVLGLRAQPDTLRETDHNHIERETHDGSLLYVHRKGAMRARVGDAGVVPGSMATPSFHVAGRGCGPAMCSSAHGAGRAMSRGEARSRVSRRRLCDELAGVFTDERHLAKLVDEAPSAYKDIRAVMKAQRKLVRAVRTLRPILTRKGTG